MENQTKQCSKCKEIKQLDEFAKRKNGADGLRNQCRKCRNISKVLLKNGGIPKKLREAKELEKLRLKKENKRYCNKCKEIKELDDFYRHSANKDGIGDICKACCILNRERYEKLPMDEAPEIKKCGKCGIVKSSSEFHKTQRNKDGLRGSCRDCRKIECKERKNRKIEEPPPVKICSNCKIEKSINLFSKNKLNKYGFSNKCKLCARNDKLKAAYGITISDYDEMLNAQNSTCKICKKPQKENTVGNGGAGPKVLAVDHDHKTGQVRGLLCCDCNRAIGLFRDNPESLEKAAEYLRACGNIK